MEKLKKFALFVNYTKAGAAESREQFIEICNRSGCTVFEINKNDECPLDAECMVCIGGDGTFLRAAAAAYSGNIPVIGINHGTLGFLTEVESNEMAAAVNLLSEGGYDIKERMVISIDLYKKDGSIKHDYAFNDVVFSRGGFARSIRLKMSIEGTFINSVMGDGVILSTPIGSTAYTLSSGGPFIDPELDVLIMTPICPHSFYSRSMVIDAGKYVELELDTSECDGAPVTVDGERVYRMEKGEGVMLTGASHPLKIVKLYNDNYYGSLMTKIKRREERLSNCEKQET